MSESFSLPTVLVTYVALLFALSVHEASHATVAYYLGDDTAKRMGRMTLNPIAHMDLLGTLILPLLGMLTGWRVLGWAKPVPVDPRNLTRHFRARVGMAAVAAAGPLSNFLQSLFFIPILAIMIRYLPGAVEAERMKIFQAAMFLPVEAFSGGSLSNLQVFALTLLGRLVIINVALALFNLLPVGPLDGSNIIRGFLPIGWLAKYDRAQPAISIALLVLFLFGFIGIILGPLFFVAETFYLNPTARFFLGV